jgi:predicted TIM-barrel fold metal-dependent hydrolase
VAKPSLAPATRQCAALRFGTATLIVISYLKKKAGTLKIDSHLHVNFKKLGVNQLISYMDREGIDKCWLLTWEEVRPPDAFFYRSLPIEEVFRAYEKYPSRIIPMYAPDPNRPDAAERFMEWHGRGIRGCGELKATLEWDSPKLDPLLSYLDDNGLPLVFHMEGSRHLFRPITASRVDKFFAKLLNTPRLGALTRGLVDAAIDGFGPLKERKGKMSFSFPGYLLDFAALEARLQEFPNINFIGHGPLFWDGFTPADELNPLAGATCRLMDEYDNLYADLSAHSGYSALTRDPQFTKNFLVKHSRKILFGTDNFFLGLGQFLHTLELPYDVGARIYGGNAEMLLNFSGNFLQARLAS